MFKFHENRNETSEKIIGEKELEKYIDSDLQCLSHLPVNFGSGDQYCQCGKKRSVYPCKFANFWYTTNVSCSGRREMTADDILKVDRNKVFLTKRNLMMNQFLEYTNATPPTPSIKNVQVVEDDNGISWLHTSFSRSRFALCNIDESNSGEKNSATHSEKSDVTSPTSSFCTSSSLFLDKRVVCLLRGITLYWFICLNTVLAKSELLKKKSPIALISDINCDTATALLDAVSAANSTSISPFSSTLADLQVSLSLLENAYDLESDILWNLFRDSFIEESRILSRAFILLPFDQSSKNNLLEQFAHSLVNTWVTMWTKSRDMHVHERRSPYLGPFKPLSRAEVLDHKRNCLREVNEWAKDDTSAPLDLRVRTQSVSSDHDPSHETTTISPLDLRLTRRSVSLDFYRQDMYSVDNIVHDVATPPRRFNEEQSTMSVEDVNEDPDNRFSMPMPETVSFEISRENYWKFIARVFGDPETNAAFDNCVANANEESNLVDVLIPADRIKVEPAEPPVDVENMDEPEELDDAAMLYVANPLANQIIDAGGHLPNNDNRVAPIDDDMSRGPYECNPCWTEKSNQEPLEQLNGIDEISDYSGSPSPPPPAAIHDDALFTFSHLSDDQYMDVDMNLQLVNHKPEYYDGHVSTVYAPNHQNFINKNDLRNIEEEHHESPTLENDPSAEFDPSRVYVAELPPSSSVPFPSADWSCCSIQSASAGTHSGLNSRHQFDNEVISVNHSKGGPTNASTAEDDYEPPGSDVRLPIPPVCPASYRSSTSKHAAQFQNLIIYSPLDLPTSLIANPNSSLSAYASPVRSGSLVTSTDGSDVCSPYPTSAIPTDQVAASHSADQDKDSSSELPVESQHRDNQSAFPAAGFSTSDDNMTVASGGAAKEGDVACSESDDSELIALIHPPEAHKPKNLTPNEDRYFLPQGMLSGNQQECAEFNMWRWPWVNSVQLLHQEPTQPQTNERTVSNESQFPPYQMWKMPFINVVSGQYPRSAYTPQPPVTSAMSLQLQPPLCRSDAGTNAINSGNASSEYSLWSSPKLVDVEQLSNVERQLFADKYDTTSNPMPSHDGFDEAATGIQFPTFVPIIRGRVLFSDCGAFQYYRRQLPVNSSISEDVEMKSPPSAAKFHYMPTQHIPSPINEEMGADEEVSNLTDEDGQLSPPLDSPYVFRPLAPAFKVLKDVQPPMLRSASGLKYHQNGRQLFVFEHEVDSKSNDPYLFQPKYAVSLNNKACQTEPELLYASVVNLPSSSPYPINVSSSSPYPVNIPISSPYSVRSESSNASQTAQPHLSPNLAMSQFWPPPHQQPAPQAVVGPQQLWPAYHSAASAAAASTSQPWPNLPFPSTYQPTAPATFYPEAQLPPQAWPTGQLQYYSLEDMFNRLGQPGFANVGEYDLTLAMSFSSN